MAQNARPDADVQVGGWSSTGANLFSVLDESSANDADYISQAGTSFSPDGVVTLSNVTDPSLSTGHKIWARCKGSTAAGTVVVTLYQGNPTGAGSPIAVLTTTTLTTGFVDYSYTLSAGEANAITDYTDLYLEFFSGASFNTVYVSQAWFEVPDVPPLTGQVNETIVWGEAIKKDCSKLIADLLTFSTLTGTTANKLVAESWSVTDTIVIGFPAGFVTEVLSFTDARLSTLAKLIVEEWEITLRAGGAAQHYVIETLSLTDDVEGILLKIIIETLTSGFSDTIKKQAKKLVKEPWTINDVRVALAVKLIAETLSYTEGITKNPNKKVIETWSMSEAFADTLLRTIAETLTYTETVKKTPIKLIADTWEPSDTIKKQAIKLISETWTITDTIAGLRIFLSTVVESWSMSDTIKKTPNKLILEPITVGETVVRATNKLVTDALSLTDTVSSLRVLIGLAAEVWTITETIAKAAEHSVSEAITLSDTIKKEANKAIAESITLTDSLASQLAKLVVEMLSMSDARLASFTKAISEALSFSDSQSNSTTQPTTSLVDVIEHATQDEIVEIAGLLLEIHESGETFDES